VTDWPRTTATQSKLYSYTAEYHKVADQPALRPCHTAHQLSRLHCHSHTRPISTAHQHRRTAWSTATHNTCVTTSRYTLQLLLQPSPQLSLQWRSVSAVDAAYMFNTSQCTIDRLHPVSHTDTHRNIIFIVSLWTMDISREKTETEKEITFGTVSGHCRWGNRHRYITDWTVTSIAQALYTRHNGDGSSSLAWHEED